MNLLSILDKIPVGYSEVEFQNKKYGLTRTNFNKGKSLKIFAEELGGTNFISLNYYRTSKGDVLKPCEMPEAKVIQFLKGFTFYNLPNTQEHE